MSDELNNKERVVKDLLTNAQFDLDVADVWSQLEGKLPPVPTQKRRVVPFWWLLGLAALSLSSIYLGYELAVMPTAPLQADTEQQALVFMTDGDTVLHGERSKSTTDEAPHKVPPVGNDHLLAKEQEKMTADAGNTLPAAPQTPSASQVQKVSIVEGQPTEAATYWRGHTGDSRGQEATIPATKKIPQQLPASKSLHAGGESPAEPAEDKSASEPPAVSAQRTSGKVSQLPLPQMLISSAAIPLPAQAIVRPHGSSAYSFTIGVRGGAWYNMASQSITDVNSELNNSIFGPESGVASANMALDIGVEHRSGWRLIAGVGIHDAVHRYARTDESVRMSTTDGTAFIIIADDGSTQSVAGEVPLVTTVQYDLQWHRRHRIVEAHVGLGKTIWHWGRLSVGADALLGYAVNTSHAGYEYDNATGAIVKMAAGEDNNYRSNQGFSAAFMARLSLHLGQADVSLIPVWRHQLSPFTNTQSFYKSTNSQLGLQLGITYRPAF